MITEKIFKQVLAIRDTGLTNMLDYHAVQRLAFERDFHELVCFIDESPREYFELILRGRRN